ncbi:MAG: hypothetical protein ABSE70_07085 [Candidatus Limnocylindrales bacterium]
MPAYGELFEPTESESSAVAVSEMAVASPERGHGGVAILLTIAAVVAAIVGARVSMVSSAASDSWQSALRAEVKRSAGAMDDVRYLYQTELPVAIRILEARLVQGELQAAAATTTGLAGEALQVEADVQAGIASGLISSSDLAAKPDYALPSGGFDLGKRLADLRAQNPALMALDPDGLEAAGDKLAHKAELLTLALFPTSIGAFLGVLAQPFKRRRGLLLAAGSAALAAGALMALGVEALA